MYPYNIGSIVNIHPNLAEDPAVQNNPTFDGIDASNFEGMPIHPAAANNAEGTVAALKSVQRNYPHLITDPVLETARNRAHILRQTYASVEFGVAQPVPGAAIQEQLVQFERNFHDHLALRLAPIEARIENAYISARNRQFLAVGRRLIPLQKRKPGNGHAKALAIIVDMELSQNLLNYQPNAEIGNVTDQWNSNTEGYMKDDFLKLVIYYNEDFGICVNDSAADWRRKVQAWLCDE